MAFTPVRPNDPLDQPSHSGLHNQHSTDIEALQEFYATLAGGEAGEVLAKTTGDDYDYDWLPGGTGGGPGGDYPGISTEDPNGLGLGTDGGLRVEPSDLLSDNAGQQLTVTPDDGKLHMAYQIVDAVPDDTDGEVGDVVFIPGGPGGSPAVGGGKVLQVVRATDSTNRTTTSTSYVDVPGMSVTITPTKATSAVMIIANCMCVGPGASNEILNLRITDSSDNPISGAEGSYIGIAVGTSLSLKQTLIAYATPATTSAVTYKLQFSVNGGTGSVNNLYSTGQMYAIELADVVVSP